MNDDLIAYLRQGLDARATVYNCTMKELPDLMNDTVRALPGVELSNVLGEEETKAAPALPERRLALSIRPMPHTILITYLKPKNNIADSLVPILWWMACVRARLTPRERADLYCFLVARSENQSNNNLQRLRETLERDNRFCRKLVWIAPSDSEKLKDSLELFIDRTFLAQPWKALEPLEARSLDPMSELVGEMSRETGLSVKQLAAWLSVLGGGEQAGRELAEQLIEIVEVDDEHS